MKSINVNEKIVSHRVVLINSAGENKGEFLKSAAITEARSEGLDLVQVGDKNGLPICRIMDYGKAQYEKQKQEKHQKHAPVMKSIRFSYSIDPHDVEVKRKQIQDFLAMGHRVQLVMKIHGRERSIGGAKEKFLQLVQSFSSDAVLTDLKESMQGYNFTINPGTK